MSNAAPTPTNSEALRRSAYWGHETFLLRSAQADPDDVGICVVDDGSDHLVPFRRRERPQGRRISAYNINSRNHSFKLLFKLCRDPSFPSVKKVAKPGPGRHLAHFQHVVGTVNAAHVLVPLQAPDPDRRHAIRGT